MYKILVIEDDKNIRDTLSDILQLKSYSVFTAENGKEGLSQAALHKPDIIFCDVMMPVMDGIETLRYIRQNSSLAHTPFVFLTAKNQQEDFRNGMNMGADDYLVKPFQIGELFNIVNKRIKRVKQITKNLEEERVNLKSLIENQQEKIEAFSYANSHLVRTPLTRILGLINLLHLEPKEDTTLVDFEVLTMLRKSCHDLDLVIHEVNNNLQKDTTNKLNI